MSVKEASARYLVTCGVASAGQDVPTGFKRTEAGVIPEDWLALPFDRLFRRLNGKNYQVLASDYEPYGQLPVIDQGQDLVAGWTDRLEKRFDCPTGGVVVFGDHTRVVKYVSSDFAVGADGTQLLVGSDPESTRFLAYQMQATEIPSAGYSRHFKFLADSFFALPPSAGERAQIAEALSDADALIESLQQLIAKKRALKQGAMQALLTGRQRLSSFSKPWAECALADAGVFRKGQGVTRAEANSGELPCVRYGELYTVHENVIHHFASKISAEVASRATLVRKGDILFAGSGETKEEIGKCAALVDDVIAYAGGDIVIFRPSEGDATFYGYLLNAGYVNDQKSARGQGDAVVHISAASLATVSVRLPSMEEQAAISTVLSDMDAEINALEVRLAKTRDLKAGMMQALLTGRIRLPLDQAA